MAIIQSLYAIPVPQAANPSGTIGLTANNGSAATWARSDATPALSQAIVPTWTGMHTFSSAAPYSAQFSGGPVYAVGRMAALGYTFSGNQAIDQNHVITSPAPFEVAFGAGNPSSEAIRIDANLQFGIGITTPAARHHTRTLDAVTNALTTVSIIEHQSSGTPAANFGVQSRWRMHSSTTTGRDAAAINVLWDVATDASRQPAVNFVAMDASATRTAISYGANGSAATLSFYGATKIARPTALTAALTAITFTAPGVADYALQDVTNVAPWGFADAEELRTFISVVRNNQLRISELESRLNSSTGVGLITA